MTDSVVKTYVPEYQKDEWREHADDLDMSLSEFVRTMVQAGRRGFLDGDGDPDRGDLEANVLDALADGVRSWDELRDHLVEDVESDLETALNSLQDQGQIRYSGREGGYTRVERA